MLYDTSVLIDYLRRGDIKNVRCGSISIVTLTEILRGIQNAKKREKIKEILERIFYVYPIDNSVVIEYCELYNRLRQCGRPLSDNDLIVAATAKAHGEKLVT